MAAVRVTVTVDLEYEVQDATALSAATRRPEFRPGPDSEWADRIAELLDEKVGQGTFNVPGAVTLGHTLTLPG